MNLLGSKIRAIHSSETAREEEEDEGEEEEEEEEVKSDKGEVVAVGEAGEVVLEGEVVGETDWERARGGGCWKGVGGEVAGVTEEETTSGVSTIPTDSCNACPISPPICVLPLGQKVKKYKRRERKGQRKGRKRVERRKRIKGYKVSSFNLSRTILNSKVEPFPSSECTNATVPPIFSQNLREIDNPNPVPPYLRVFPVSSCPKG